MRRVWSLLFTYLCGTVVGLMLCGGLSVLYAQPSAAEPTTPTGWYTSVAGVIAVTMIVVSVIKRAWGNIPFINAIPTWVYSVIVSAVLTVLTVAVWHTLPGDLWQTMMQAVMMAASASGFYSWLNEPKKSLATSAVAAGVPVQQKNMPAN